MNRIVIIHCTACHRHITAQIYKNICSILILSHSDFDSKSFFEHSFFFYETLFPTAAGIGSLSECNELSEQALFRVAILRGAVFI